jgi:hypoxanthine phosphoribosyltransferase
MTTETLGDNILLVDDLADSGKTLKEGIIWLNNEYRALTEIRSAV